MKNSNFPLVSVIITTKNEEKHIADCLNSVKRQEYPQNKIEIIVVDNNSSDKTKGIAKRYTNLIFDKGPERSAQRNFGVLQSRGKWILYLDADMILSPQIIEECMGKVKTSKAIALYIPETIMGEKYWNKVRRFERSFYDGTVIDAVRFIEKRAFMETKGFDETMSGPEDWDFDKKIRNYGKVDIITSQLFHNEGDFEFKGYLNKKSYYIQSFDKYVDKWGKNDPDIKKQLGLHHRFVGIFIENGKWRKLISHPFLTSGMYFLRGSVGIKYLIR